MLSSNTISVFLIMVRSLSRKGLFGKLLANVVVSLMKSFINLGLSSWCFCFFSCAVEDSTSSNSSVIQQGSALHNFHLTIAELSCRLMREVAPLTLFMHSCSVYGADLMSCERTVYWFSKARSFLLRILYTC